MPIIEPLIDRQEIEGVLAVENASFTNPWTREMYEAELEHGARSHFLLAKEQGCIIGFCSYWYVVDELHINNLAVLPANRGRGVASAILARLLDDGRRAGVQRILLEVRQSNEPARRLYERFGFVVGGVRRGYYTHPTEDALVLWREELSGRSVVTR
jgi:ribosomal-protein-alanine N-acetyltransferase